jgi:hypothetical protein
MPMTENFIRGFSEGMMDVCIWLPVAAFAEAFVTKAELITIPAAVAATSFINLRRLYCNRFMCGYFCKIQLQKYTITPCSNRKFFARAHGVF